jgi:glycosyltransferase involved in cell wall biosynthesis
MLKEAGTIVRHGLATQVIILSAGESGQSREEMLSNRIRVHRIVTFLGGRSKFSRILFYFEFYLRASWYGMKLKPQILNCHSLMMLPVAVLIKQFTSARLIYDPHELETERLGLNGLARKISKIVERKLISACQAVVVVSPSIQCWYKKEYPGKIVTLVRNVPRFTPVVRRNLFREKLGIPHDKLIFLSQGLLNEGRSINLYLEVFSRATHHHLVIMGYGPLEFRVKEAANSHPNIHFFPAVRPDEVLTYTQSADVGLSLIENYCLSYYYSLPNKFFEYIMAEVPPIVSDFPDMAEIVSTYRVGWAINVGREDLYDAIQMLTRLVVDEHRTRMDKARQQLCWENEEHALISVFKNLLTVKS